MKYVISVSTRVANRITATTLAFATSATMSDPRLMRNGYTTDDTDQCLFDLDMVQSTAALTAETHGAEILALNASDGRRILIDLF